jgi:hypothetical protein
VILLALVGSASAATLTVCPSACNQPTIAAAIAAASSGDTLSLTAATYTEDGLVIDKNLTITGASNPTLTSTTGDQLTIASGVTATLRGLTLSPAVGRGVTVSTGGTVVVDTCAFPPHTVANHGAGIFGDAAHITVTSSTFAGLYANDTTLSADGGAIATTGASVLSVTDSSFTSCHATDQAGAIDIKAGGAATLTRCTFDQDLAPGQGGGAVRVINGALNVVDSTFTRNSNTAVGTGNGGGAILSTDSVLAISGSVFDANTAANAGGAVRVAGAGGNATITATRFHANTAAIAGGAMSVSYSALGSQAFVLRNSVLDANTTTADPSAAGGIYAQFVGTITLTDNVFTNNVSKNASANFQYAGGALMVYQSGTLTGLRNQFCDNRGLFGGGATTYNMSGATTWSNNLFVGNQGDYDGGGLDSSGGDVAQVRNNVFLDDAAPGQYGGGALWSDGTTTFSGNIVASTRNGYGVQGYSPFGGTINLTYDDWWLNVPGNTYNTTAPSSVTNDFVNPMLWSWNAAADDCAGDFRIRYTSPLRNDGDPATAQKDLDGSANDIGLYGGPNADPAAWVDADTDGYPWVYDCDEANPALHPNATELCNGIDDDCDALIDETAPVWYADADNDGFGATATSTSACTAPVGYVALPGDCDDANAAIRPGATETCDGADQDCDGSVDEGAGSAWHADADGDGYGSAASLVACTQPTGTVADGTDCDDTDAAVHATGTRFTDSDGDAYGNGAVQVCGQPAGTAAVGGDCNDAAAAIHPGATEICDGLDQDCDSQVDDGVTTTFHRDADNDGYGSPTVTTQACSAPAGHVADGTDCDDASAIAHPGASEVCNGRDDDCDGTVDDGLLSTFYADTDGDGFGDPSVSSSACTAPAGFVAVGTDCDDADGTAYPGAPEACDGVDDDCDGSIDDNVVQVTWYADTDDDGFGNAASTQQSCAQPAGTAGVAGDCDDGDDTVHPGADEHCDTVDEDCDGTADDAPVDGTSWHTDADGDAYGAAAVAAVACTRPSGTVANATDCNDAAPGVHPTATETCDGVDEDCDGTVDDGIVDVPWYADADQDGFGDPADAVIDCRQPAGRVADASDCDDTDPAVAGATPWYADADGDGFGDAAAPAVACTPPSGTVADATDCDDAVAAANPASPEICDAIDDDCDGAVDEDAVDAVAWAPDADGDGYGEAGAAVPACDPPTGSVPDATDCDDTLAAAFPGATEVCDGVDDDCDGAVDDGLAFDTWYLDGDGDGAGPDATATSACAAPSGGVAVGGDCDDADPTIGPLAAEVCDGIDQDCDGVADQGLLIDWYADADGDGVGGPPAVATACTAPSGTVATSGDCDDTDVFVNDRMTELCSDGIDNDCDGLVDEVTVSSHWYLDLDGDGLGNPLISRSTCARQPGYVLNDDDCDDGNPGVGVAATWYPDGDGDGDGDPTAPIVACAQPSGTVTTATDCDDTDPDVHPGALELCDRIDNDCTGVAEDDDAITWYADFDGDGYGDPFEAYVGCQVSGYVADATDCDDTTADAYPGGVEICDFLDDDCDGDVDEGLTASWFEDSDQDGFGDPASEQVTCLPPPDAILDGTDCDDADPAVSPDAVEACNGVDDDCANGVDDGLAATTWYADGDGDGFGATTSVTACEAPAGYVAAGGDCDDTVSAVFPGAAEACDGADDDCDGTVDDGLAELVYYADVDQDGFGDPDSSVSDCRQPAGFVEDGTDCDDTRADVSPDADEVWYDGIDQDCDGVDADRDGDGHDAEAAGGDDCDDDDPAVFDDCAGDSPADTDGGGKGCGCATGRPGEAALLVLAGLALRRRRA